MSAGGAEDETGEKLSQLRKKRNLFQRMWSRKEVSTPRGAAARSLVGSRNVSEADDDNYNNNNNNENIFSTDNDMVQIEVGFNNRTISLLSSPNKDDRSTGSRSGDGGGNGPVASATYNNNDDDDNKENNKKADKPNPIRNFCQLYSKRYKNFVKSPRVHFVFDAAFFTMFIILFSYMMLCEFTFYKTVIEEYEVKLPVASAAVSANLSSSGGDTSDYYSGNNSDGHGNNSDGQSSRTRKKMSQLIAKPSFLEYTLLLNERDCVVGLMFIY
jgi:hypothetical protein